MPRLTHLITALIAFQAIGAHGGSPLQSTASAPSSVGTAIRLQPPDMRGTKSVPLIVEPLESAEDAIDKREQAKYREIDSKTARWVMWLTGGMLLIAAMQAWFFFVQLRLMRASMKVAQATASATEQTVEAMKDTAHRQLRAYVSIDKAWIKFPEPGVPSVTVTVKNAGQTPAHDLRHWIHQWIEKHPLQVELPVPPEGFVMSTSLLGAGATHDMRIEHPKPIIKQPFLDQIGTPEATIYVYGQITYKDVFGQHQYLKYRLMHGGQTKNPPGILSPCEEGNEAT